jgi:hypothetical protein
MHVILLANPDIPLTHSCLQVEVTDDAKHTLEVTDTVYLRLCPASLMLPDLSLPIFRTYTIDAISVDGPARI